MGRGGTSWQGCPIKVKDMLLKQAIEEEHRRDQEAMEAFKANQKEV